MLSLRNVVVHYGGVRALKSISLAVEKGGITSLIGANGAGKSTTLKAVSGLVPITSGEILFEGQRIDGWPTEKIVELGIGHVPEGKQLFLDMSVLDNLLTGAYLRRDTENLARDLEWIYGYFPVLGRAQKRKASQLSGGEQQMVAIGRGLMSKPKLLLLDEPSLGLSPILTLEVGAIIKRIAAEGVSILLIEQNANLALQLAQRSYVLETGTIVLEGDSRSLADNEHVRAAYLGLSPTEGPAVFRAPEREAARAVEVRPPAERREEVPAGKGPPPPAPTQPALPERWPPTEPPDRRAPEWPTAGPTPAFSWTPDGQAPDQRIHPGYAEKGWTYGPGPNAGKGWGRPPAEEPPLDPRPKKRTAPVRVIKKSLTVLEKP
ncbi:MAG: ABC transporter ATP-binding protein [Thermodesulfobacteriota bacterium]